MAVLLVGGGLVGSQIARVLVDEGERPIIFDYAHQPEALSEIVDLQNVTLVQGDILNSLSLPEAIRDHGVTRIIHTAAYPMLTPGAQQNPYASIQINIIGTANVLEAARIFGVERVVVASSGVLSMSMEGGGDGGDISKEEAYPRPTTFYAAAKQSNESLGLNYARWCGLDFRAVRYAAIAGPWPGRGGGGPSNLFIKIVEGALLRQEAVIPSHGSEWVYSKDAARGTVLALNAAVDTERVFNIGIGRIFSAEDMASALKSVLPSTRVSIAPPDPQREAMFKSVALDLTRTRKVLGYEPQYDLEGAIRDYVQWYQDRKG